jgi:hypothetical protein
LIPVKAGFELSWSGSSEGKPQPHRFVKEKLFPHWPGFTRRPSFTIREQMAFQVHRSSAALW